MKRTRFFEKTIALVLSNMIAGTMMFGFSILISRRAGAGAMGLYQLVMPLYGLFLFASGGGVTVAMSKIAAEKKAQHKFSELHSTVRQMCIVELVWSMFIAVIILMASVFLSGRVLHDDRTLYGIVAFCPAIVFVSISSVYKGAFFGLQSIAAPALIDISEKLFRLSSLAILLVVITNIAESGNITLASAAAVLSLSIGELFSLILLRLAYQAQVRKLGSIDKNNPYKVQLVADVLRLSLPLALNGIVSTGFATIQTVLIPARLQAGGMPYEDALAVLGQLNGMALAILFYPAIIVSSFNILLIPALSEARILGRTKTVTHQIRNSLRIAAISSFYPMVVLLVIPDTLAIFFFKDASVGDLLQILAPSLPFLYFLMSFFAMLNGLGRQKVILVISTLLSIIDLALLYVLLAIPSVGVKGYALDMLLSTLIGLGISFYILRREIGFHALQFQVFIPPALGSLFTLLMIDIGEQYLSNHLSIIILSLVSYISVLVVCEYLPRLFRTNRKPY